MARVLRKIVAGFELAVQEPPAGERPRGRAAVLAGLLERRLVAVEERDGRRVYVPTEVGRAEVDSVAAGGT